ncbi:MAG TPA: FG-GAP-like repeat-containing protein [Acidobacteriaceae bacterium]|nr:FG-GAP-like repeat-containing protein [Acidobacteriaceae bacterium]
MAFAATLFRPAPFFGAPFPGLGETATAPPGDLPFADVRLAPRYPATSPLTDIVALVPPGADGYISEKYAHELQAILEQWSHALRQSPEKLAFIASFLDSGISGTAAGRFAETPLRSRSGIEAVRRTFAESVTGRDAFLHGLRTSFSDAAGIDTAEFEIFAIEAVASSLLTVRTRLRYDIVLRRRDRRREERVGSWQMEWVRGDSGGWTARRWDASPETDCSSDTDAFADIAEFALGATGSWRDQLLHGSDYWRTVLDGAVGVDVYGNNGVAAGDFNNDGFDDLYVCQPAGLPNRLYRNCGDGTFEDVTERAGVGVLDNTACALFVDFDNRGWQDLLVVCGTGPLLFVNQGDGTFSLRRDAFQFARPPQGTFTHAAVADYDGDGRLDIHLCLYMYYLGLDQYHYPIPYYDARNGPPNCLFHNGGGHRFVETTEAAGLNADNNRYSFACAWGNAGRYGLPDLFVANDFGSSQLYRNNGNGTFTVVSREANVEGVGAGMSCCWCDYDNDGLQDIYVPSMWEAAGQRVSEQERFHANAPASIRELYQRHARGNALYRNQATGRFENEGREAAVEMGRWSWGSDFWDFDHDGFSDLYVTNGYISEPDRDDLASFFWRQIVGHSPDDATPSVRYERGWNAINELIRSDHTWHGYARNVFFLNLGNGTFAEASAPTGLDFSEDSRCFVLADIDHDGRLEVILKNRNAPQLRVLHNQMKSIGKSVSFQLRGHRSNRDAIGAAITVETAGRRQTKYLQAGSGFLSQHSKEVFFGIGGADAVARATIHWPSGARQVFANLPAGHRIAIDEDSEAFHAAPFLALAPNSAVANSASAGESLPRNVQTWLIEPLKAPAFSLPDVNGTMQELRSYRGGIVLLLFWSVGAPLSVDALRKLEKDPALRSGPAVTCVAVNVDDATQLGSARSTATQERISFPVLFATEEIAGVYNLIYRYMFDRRRDLPIPSALLLDSQGMIVKVYQGAVDPEDVLRDSRSMPVNAADRMRRALPFPGILVQDKLARNDFTYGVAMFQHGFLDQAQDSFLQVLATRPDDADALYNLGTLSLRRRDFSAGRRYLEQAVQLRPNYPEAWNNLGMIAAEEGQPDEAVRHFQQSLAYRPSYAIALLNLGNVYRRQRLFDQAHDCLNRALELLPDDAEISYSLGMLYAQQNQLQPASDYLRRALVLKPDYPEALNNLGIVFVRLGNYSLAEEEFRTGIRVAPSFDQSYLNLARLYALENDREHARQVLSQLLALQPENASARRSLEQLQ